MQQIDRAHGAAAPRAGKGRRGAALAAALAMVGMAAAGAQAPASLPPAVQARLAAAGLGDATLSAVVLPVPDAGAAPVPRLSWQAEARRPAASLMKLFTTFTALERLGPAWTWRTPVWLDGELRDGELRGDLVVRGSGDPALTAERLWLLLQDVQRHGVRRISGDIVLDDSGYALPAADPSRFDGEPLKPYNVQPHALLAALGSVGVRFSPVPGQRWARVDAWPDLDGVRWPARIPLAAAAGEAVSACGDWQAAVRLDLSAPRRPRLDGRYPVGCGEREWRLAWPDPADHARRLVAATWRGMGGKLGGSVRTATAHPAVDPSFFFDSPPLAEVVRSINKFSNNTMARALFLALGQPADAAVAQPATLEAARTAVAAHIASRAACGEADLLLDNGSGLSRTEAASAACLARLLAAAWASPVMPELLSSLPIAAVDGTTRRMNGAAGRAHLKTGTLDGVVGIAGYVLGDSGRRWIVVGIVHAPDAGAARPALDALVAWVADDKGNDKGATR
ncbi:MAG: D-alanyl-D-alanine carboxypeptidase/D-alanyl-D-alanine-endopeptidase [Aquabacterium sp.]|nr:MAG: D-alanyl-D-alanine carboxypeptidase/D-alanyl-D-alanine-endopeptidase [Aquabacterium sp.]